MIQSHGYAAHDKDSDLQIFHFEREEPGPHDVLIEILFCGVCHSDLHQVRNEWHNTLYPCLPGHEIIGRVVEIGPAVSRFQAGDVVGVGCMIDSCRQCPACREGLENYCENGFLATYNGPFKPDGSNTYGGYANNIVVREEFVLRIPSGLDLPAAAPLLCAGVTTYSPLRHWQVQPGQKVGIVGLGGLGHIAVKLAKAMGAEVVIFTRDEAKQQEAQRLGAAGAVLSTDQEAMQQQESRFDLILSTIPTSHDINPYISLLKRDSTLVLVGALEPLEPGIDQSQVAFQRRAVAGSLIGSIAETQEVLDFCAEHKIAADVEIIPVHRINHAYERMLQEDVRYRFVIDMSSLRR